MKYKLFVCDLDGTLLDDKHQISQENLNAIKKLESKGIKFVIATGRSQYMVKKYIEILDYNMPLLWCNGAAITDTSGRVLDADLIETAKARQIIDLARKHNLPYMIYSLQGIHSEVRDARTKPAEAYNIGVEDEHKAPLIIDENLYDKLDQYQVVKVFINSPEYSNMENLRDRLNEEVDGIQAMFSQRHILDITNCKASKGEAILKLAKYLDLDLEEIVAIGDNHNDISMLKVCGLALTVENAEKEVKEIATCVDTCNNLSGVADAINNFMIK